MKVDLRKAFVNAYFRCIDNGIFPTRREVTKAIEQDVRANFRKPGKRGNTSVKDDFALGKDEFEALKSTLDKLCDEKSCERFTILTDNDVTSWHKNIFSASQARTDSLI